MSVLRAGAHESQIRSAPVLGLPRLQGFSYHAVQDEKSSHHDCFFRLVQAKPADLT
ncbi:hypothetical protein [Bacillus pumilus]|uniref:hypothetical protein n=1 Tax=Bacillus pumilus TaxID=1408 RepID=UPI001B828353|nr:hypothetical protein [Bacillus pumilus]MBR0620925.1 hypothetical protein [Bacillus pumilus]